MDKFNIRTISSRAAIGIISIMFMSSAAYSDSKIQPNPDYFKQSPALAEDAALPDATQSDFDQFLGASVSDDPDQYILLTEPKDGNRPVISLNDDDEGATLFQVGHEYNYEPSLSFNLPNVSSGLEGFAASNSFSGKLGGSQLILSLDSSDTLSSKIQARKSLRFLFGSSFMQKPVDNYSAYVNKNSLAQRAYNLSMGVGYSGFQLGATFSHNDYLFASDLSGFDVGFGYEGRKWSANLKVGEYSRNRGLLLTSEYDIFDTVSAYELGAAYRLFSNVNFTGRFTYYSYGQAGSALSVDDIQTLIFGTNLSF